MDFKGSSEVSIFYFLEFMFIHLVRDEDFRDDTTIVNL